MTAVELNDVTKEFRMYDRYQAGVKSLIVHPFRNARRHKPVRFRAVDHVSVNILHGECFGILGRNGAGKSTLLALIAGVLRPTSGTISVHGRISPLLELGVGFTPELTGRENIVINGVLLGLRRREITAIIEEIIAFADIADFIDQPLKTFSSGMQSRLGFAIAVHIKPNILLVDEVLSVGDTEFQQKCLRRIDQLRQSGATIVFVSHNLQTVENICDRAIWLEKGRVVSVGAPKKVIDTCRANIAAGSGIPRDENF